MRYVKNLTNRALAVRLIKGVLALVYAASNWGRFAMMAMSGLIGFCPMCAMVGRKLDKGH